jgi:GTP-binding protein EngB required for normal cell division
MVKSSGYSGTSLADFPSEVRVFCKYSARSLMFGRPLSKTVIMTFGQSGAGKSSLINFIFDDETVSTKPLCDVNDRTSTTTAVFQHERCFTVPDRELGLNVRTSLALVDVPGTSDTREHGDQQNFCTISKFLEESTDLQAIEFNMDGLFDQISYSDKVWKALDTATKQRILLQMKVREQVYPNVVMLVVRINDNRIDGEKSALTKTLKTLEDYMILDKEYPNLLVVVTHSFQVREWFYNDNVTKIREQIERAIEKSLKVKNVPVVFTDNCPERCKVEKERGFYLLPDGVHTPLNIFEALDKLFLSNGDQWSLQVNSK